jgi:hypothetical protein
LPQQRALLTMGEKIDLTYTPLRSSVCALTEQTGGLGLCEYPRTGTERPHFGLSLAEPSRIAVTRGRKRPLRGPIPMYGVCECIWGYLNGVLV